jgi:hypothetical protein
VASDTTSISPSSNALYVAPVERSISVRPISKEVK